NADDFGLSAGINRGIIEAHERGIVTSASLMVRGSGAAAAADYGRKDSRLSVGLHIDLAEWIFRDGAWTPLYQVVELADPAAVEQEVLRQLDAFNDLLGRPPTHLDSHQHIHRDEPLRTVAQRLAAKLKVPLRHFSAVQYCGSFYGQSAKGDPVPEAIRADALLAVLRCLPPGITELACHPGYPDDVETTYRAERACEVAALCDPRLRQVALEQRIELVNFSAIAD
ncbi:MAG TPA: ChbG/HpnK family deacetylase, partial [Pirellulales bacterium]|nr:ChbG/HpnK family deacetylase [Pirellulales bacterium]